MRNDGVAVGDLTERELIGRIRQRLQAPPDWLIVGIGDDAAVVEPERNRVEVLTVDCVVDGVHFDRAFVPPTAIGHRALAVNLSDLAAMGAEPEALLVGLALPPEMEPAAIVELYEGLNEPRIPVAGGDTTRADALVLSVTAVGRSKRVPGRSGARPGDRLVVTGPLGGAAAGLHALREGLAGFDDLVERHRRPPIRLEEGRRLAPIAHALIDLSDGIGGDAARLAARSGCRLVLDPALIPRAPRSEEVAELPFWTLGEDYELLAAVAPDDAAILGYAVVGACEEGAGVEPEWLAGWDSFRPR